VNKFFLLILLQSGMLFLLLLLCATFILIICEKLKNKKKLLEFNIILEQLAMSTKSVCLLSLLTFDYSIILSL
jgi:hypothetical protein